MDKNELRVLAQKYLDGTATPGEKQQLDQWYDTIHTGFAETVDLDKEETEEDIKQRVFDRLNRQRFVEPPQTVEKATVFSVKRLAVWIGSAAAVIAMVVFARVFINQQAAPKTQAATRQLVSVPSNRVIHITLPDGSKVSLNAGSIFRCPKSFTGKTREVELVEGQAFFDVKHQSDHPFIVKTKNLNITVYGTSFDVRSYKNEGKTRVSVVTGKVGVTMPDQADQTVIMLVAHQQVVLSTANNQLVKQQVVEADVNDWIKTNFVFEQETLNNVFKALEKEYHAKITVEDKRLLEEKITITLTNQPLDSTIQTLGYVKHFKYQMANDSTVIIK
jgi:transmembrane sensor